MRVFKMFVLVDAMMIKMLMISYQCYYCYCGDDVMNVFLAALLHGQVAPDVAGSPPNTHLHRLFLLFFAQVKFSNPWQCHPFTAEITRLEEEFQAQQSGHVPMHDVDSNDARARLWSVAAFNRMLKL